MGYKNICTYNEEGQYWTDGEDKYSQGAYEVLPHCVMCEQPNPGKCGLSSFDGLAVAVEEAKPLKVAKPLTSWTQMESAFFSVDMSEPKQEKQGMYVVEMVFRDGPLAGTVKTLRNVQEPPTTHVAPLPGRSGKQRVKIDEYGLYKPVGGVGTAKYKLLHYEIRGRKSVNHEILGRYVKRAYYKLTGPEAHHKVRGQKITSAVLDEWGAPSPAPTMHDWDNELHYDESEVDLPF